MHTTLEHLEQIRNKKKSLRRLSNFVKEIKTLFVIFAITGVVMLLFTNAQLFFGNILESISGPQKEIIDWSTAGNQQDNSISNMVSTSSEQFDAIQGLIDKYKENKAYQQNHITTSTQSSLKEKLKDYPFKFNTLPPTDRVVIPELNVDIPLITSKYKKMEDFTKGNFDTELRMGAVKYPTTANPGEHGDTLIFAHTSTNSWDRNKYGTAFKDIPQLSMGDEIQVVRKGQLHTYRVVTQNIVKPSKVNDIFMQFQNQEKDYLSLMGCYPIGKNTHRIIVTAERID